MLSESMAAVHSEVTQLCSNASSIHPPSAYGSKVTTFYVSDFFLEGEAVVLKLNGLHSKNFPTLGPVLLWQLQFIKADFEI